MGEPQRCRFAKVESVKVTRSFKFGAHDVTIETGVVARQADGAVMVNMNDTVVLVTAVGEKSDQGGRDFFPLTINYQEKLVLYMAVFAVSEALEQFVF